jgi:hypothetical protein
VGRDDHLQGTQVNERQRAHVHRDQARLLRNLGRQRLTQLNATQLMSASPNGATTEHIPSPADSTAAEISKPDTRQLLTA